MTVELSRRWVNQRPVAIVTDSTVCLSQDFLCRFPIQVVPLQLTIGDQTYQDGVDLEYDDFYRFMAKTSVDTRTSAPTPNAFLNAFREASVYATDILCLTISTRLSATYDSARLAVGVASDQFPRLNIRVLDSGAVGGALALIVLESAKYAAEGASLNLVADTAKHIAAKVQFLGVLDTLRFVSKSGRMPKPLVWASSLLKIKPVLGIQHGDINLLARPRTKERAIYQILQTMEKRVGREGLHVNVMHAGVPDEAEALQEKIGEHFNCRELFVSAFSPVMGTYTGPGLLAIAFWAE